MHDAWLRLARSQISIIISRLGGFINRLRPIECKLSNKTGKSCRSFRITPFLLFFFPSILLFFVSISFLFLFVSFNNIHSHLPFLYFIFLSVFFFISIFFYLCFFVFFIFSFIHFLSSVYFPPPSFSFLFSSL